MSPSPLPERPDPTLGGVIRGMREERGLTRIELAGGSGVDEAVLAEIEAGTADPPWAIVEALAGALDVSMEKIAAAVVAAETNAR